MTEKKRAMISQPMRGKAENEIKSVKEKAVKFLTEQGYEVINTYFTDDFETSIAEQDVAQIPLYYLAKSLEKMSLCHAVYFCDGWEKTRGCKIEHDAAVAYGLDIIYKTERM